MASPDWSIEPFDKKRHNRACFDCGHEALNDWLATKVGQFEKRNLTRTYVLVEQGQAAILGYYALSNHSIVYDALPEEQAKGLPVVDVPVVLIGRLAIHRSLQGQRLGELLLIDALRRSKILSSAIGIRAIEVDAIDRKAKRFYEKYGFVPLKDDPHHLYLPMTVVRKLKFSAR